jgi:hypothetical protein
MPASTSIYGFGELINQEIVVVAHAVLGDARYLLSPELFLPRLCDEKRESGFVVVCSQSARGWR